MAVIDTGHLLELARDKSQERRKQLARTITDLFVEQSTELTDRERVLMFDILHKMIHDAEMSVRRTISKQLAEIEDAPRDLINILANDEIEVAFPILRKSPVFQDEDLIEVVQHRTLEHQLAIAVRASVSEDVSDALVKTGNETVITNLLNNQNAKLSLATMEYLIEESKRVDTFHEPILNRNDLEPELAKRMYMWVSAALRHFIIDKYDFDESALDDLLEQTAVREIESLDAAAKAATSKTDELAAELEEEGGDTVKVMIQALREGEVSLFMTMFRRRTRLRDNLVKRIMFEPGGEGLAIACKASGFDIDEFSSIYTLSRKARPASNLNDSRDTQRILEFFDQLTDKDAHQVLDRWHRDVDYLRAIHDVEMRPKKNAQIQISQ